MIGLENFYARIDKNIKLIQGYSEISELENIIKLCRLKPYDFFIGSKDMWPLKLYRTWVDEFGNSLQIIKKNRIKLVMNDLDIDKGKIIATDFYEQLSLDKIIKMSKLCYLVIGKDEDLNEPHAILSLLGIDGYLRTYYFIYGEWHKCSSLLLGYRVLKMIINNIDIKYYKGLKNTHKVIFPCNNQETWITALPAREGFLKIINERNSFVCDLLKENK